MEATFLTILPRMVAILSLRGTWAPPAQQINGKVISRAIIGSTGRKFGTHSDLGNKQRSFGQSGTKRSLLTSGGHALHLPLSLSSVFFASQTLASRLSINSGTASKQEGHGDGPCSLCMNSAGLEQAIMTASIGNKFYLGKGFPKSMVKKLKCGTFLEVLRFGPYGSNTMTKFSIMNNSMNLRSSKIFGTSLSCTPKRCGNGCLIILRRATFR